MPPRRQNQHQLQRSPLHHRLWTGDQLRHLRLRHRSQHERLAAIGSVDDLRSVVLLQGLGWSDVEIFDAAGLRTFTGRSENLLRLVDNRRLQLFLRGIDELEREAPIVATTTEGTSLDPDLLIAYPFAGFFYVGPDN